MLLSQSVYVFEPLQLFLNPTVFKEWQTPTMSTGFNQDSDEKSIRLAKSSTSILLDPKLFRRDNNMSEISSLTDFIEEFDWNYADLDIIDRLQIKHLDSESFCHYIDKSDPVCTTRVTLRRGWSSIVCVSTFTAGNYLINV